MFFDELSRAAGGRRVSLAGSGGVQPYERGVGAEGGESIIEATPEEPLRLLMQAQPATTQRSLPLVLIAVGFALGLSILLGLWIADLTTRPLRRLVSTVDRVTAGDLSARTAVDGRDETGRLGRRLDDLIAGMQETQRLSVTDALTGLGNRRLLTEELRLEIERAARFGRCLGMLALDLDHFKAINDRYGHRAGDAVLVEFAVRLRRVIREVDLAFRQGGEEFMILLPETDLAGSLTAAQRVGEAMREAAFPLHGQGSADFPISIPVTVSVGIAVYPHHALTGADLLDAADQALYAAKAAGRDTFVLASDPAGSPFVMSDTPSVVDSIVASLPPVTRGR